MENMYELKANWMTPSIQAMQDTYAKLTGISIWLLNHEDQLISDRSLASEILPDLLEDIDECMITLNPGKRFEEEEYGAQKLLMKKRHFYAKERLLGSCVCVQVLPEDTEEIKEHFEAQANFLMEVFQDMIDKDSNIWQLNDRLKKLQADEKDMEEKNKRLQHENDFDELTKVHSRTYFYKCMDEMEKREDLLPVSVIVGDVNNLKFTNDMFGHRHGDWLLYRVAEALREEAEKIGEEIGSDIVVARCGGDEFNILMPNTKRAVANYYCHRVVERLKGTNDCCLPPSISLGSAKKSEMNQSLHRLMEVADAKMYSAKREFKQTLDQFEELMEVLFSRRFLSRCGVDKKMDMMRGFGESLGWKKETIDKCVNLTRYQDIGLTVVPERIYRKNGEYTDREWREIKKHPQLGMKLALIRSDIAPISDMMYLTHENFDGSGWPRGTSGSAIPQEVSAVRLVTEFVDYEEEHDSAAACEFIRQGSGTLFEPTLAGKFVEFLNAK